MERRLYNALCSYRTDHPYTPLRIALAIVRSQMSAPAWFEAFDTNDYDLWTGEVDGWQVAIKTESEADPDISWLGEFTDDPHGAVKNPDYQHGRYKYFRPENIQNWRDFWRQGMTRAAAKQRVVEIMHEDAKTALEEQQTISVTVSRFGCELGSTHLGWVYADTENELMWVVDDHDMIREAIDQAKRCARDPGIVKTSQDDLAELHAGIVTAIEHNDLSGLTRARDIAESLAAQWHN